MQFFACCKHLYEREGVSKTLLVMKITTFFLIVLCLNASAGGYAQKVNLDQRNVPLNKVFKEIKKQTGFTFIYTDGLLRKATRVTVTLSNASLEQALEACFRNQPLGYSIFNKMVIVKEKDLDVVNEPPVSTPVAIPVKGGVFNNKGEALSGATVTEKGTSNAVTTQIDGSFSINVAGSNALLVVSYVGYQTKEIAVKNSADVRVLLEQVNASLNDVVVVGYGTQRRKAVTGSVTKVDVKNLQNTPVTNISQALRGSVAGVQFQSNGRPGQGGNILIRGQRSITASNDPLIVLDGIIFSGSLSDISPNDVESMEVLQDASAGAIYGTRAANGVILVTTKRGTTEKPTVSFNTYYGVQDYAHKIKFHTPEQYIQTILDYRTQSGQASDPTKVIDYLQPLERDNYTNGITTDPYDLVAQDATIQSYELGVSGRTSRLSYYFSGGLTKDKGLVFNDKEDRISFRTNLEAKVTDWFRAGITAQFTQRDKSGIEAGRPSNSDFEQGPGYGTSPYASYYFDEAKTQMRLGVVSPAITNPLFYAKRNSNDDKSYNLFANIYGVVDIPFVKGLSYRINYSPNLRWDHQYTFEPLYLLENRRDSGIGRKNTSNTFDYYLENIVSYKKTFAAVHSVDVTLLYGRNNSKFDRTNVRSENFFNDALGYNNLSLGRRQTIFTDAVETNGISSMARLNYGFKDRYFITLTARRDGFSAFGPNNKFGTFPTAAVAWVVSDEGFLKNNNLISYLKLRGSYGKVGNQGIAAYSTVARLSNTFPNNGQVAYVFGDGGPTSIGLYPSNIVNNDLKWETTAKLNFGVDFELVRGRIGGTVDVYDENTSDLLLDKSISPITGFSSLRTNIGSTNNKGVNISLNTVNMNRGKFKWTTNLAFSTNKNKIVSLGGKDVNGDGREDDDILNGWFIGKPINSFYDFVFDGIYQERDALPTGYKAGYVRLADLNNDGKIDATNDRQLVGQQQPKQIWGLTNNVSYGDFSLSVQVTAMTGWVAPYIGLDTRAAYAIGIQNVNLVENGYWTAENQSNTRPSLVYPNTLQHSYYISRDFARLQNVSISYDFKNLLSRTNLNVQSARLYVSGRNLATITKWPGWDPEGSVSLGFERNRQSYQGFDRFPMTRMIVVGLNMGF